MLLDTASNLSNLRVGAGYYDLQFDDAAFSYNNLSISSNSFSGVLDVHDYTNKSKYVLPAYSFTFTGSSLGEVNSLVRIYSGTFDPRIYIGSESYDLAPDLFSPYKVYANYHIEAMCQKDNSHFSVWADNTSDISNFLVQDSKSIGNFNIDASIFIESPDVWNRSGGYTVEPDRIYSSSVTEIELIVVCPYGSYRSFLDNSLLSSVSNGEEMHILCWLTYANASDGWAFVNYDLNGSSSNGVLNAGLSSVQNSVNQVNTNMSNQLNQVKTQIAQSTNTITTKIDTMSQHIQTGLQNVITSAQQNTQNIINTVTTKVDEVKTGITEVKDSIIDLPNKIQEMLIGLVVPDEQAMIEQKEQWDTLLAERFGVVYESVEVMDTVAGSFTNATQQSTIILPSVTVPLANEEFTFGGYDVEVVPEGFGMLADALKLIIDIVVTLAFINAMKNRYEQLVSR